MSRFNNVQVLLDTAEDYHLAKLVEILDIPCRHLGRDDYDQDITDLSEDVAYVLISMWSMVPAEKKVEFKERLTDEMVNLEIENMFPND
jgi:hypothetical protein